MDRLSLKIPLLPNSIIRKLLNLNKTPLSAYLCLCVWPKSHLIVEIIKNSLNKNANNKKTTSGVNMNEYSSATCLNLKIFMFLL